MSKTYDRDKLNEDLESRIRGLYQEPVTFACRWRRTGDYRNLDTRNKPAAAADR